MNDKTSLPVKLPLLGAHTSIAGGLDKAVDLAAGLGFNTMQIFTKNSNRWACALPSEEEIINYKNKISKSNIFPVISHDSYLINLSAGSEELLEKSREAFIDEITRCYLLGIPFLNFHPGSHTGMSEEEGIRLVAESINYAHQRTEGMEVCSMIELTAGQGSSLGRSFEQVRDIINGVDHKERVCVCIDTAHIFAAGYDIRTPESYKQVMDDFESIIGFNRLKCIHINDSKKPLGSRVDRHEHIGKGFIGSEGFACIMNDPRLENVPKILETPKTKGQLEDLENMAALKSLIRNQG